MCRRRAPAGAPACRAKRALIQPRLCCPDALSTAAGAAEVRQLERQRAELQGALRRALRLADVLRRQVAHAQAARALPAADIRPAGLLGGARGAPD